MNAAISLGVPCGDASLHRTELEARCVHRAPEPTDLGFDLRRFDPAFDHLGPAAIHCMHAPDRNSIRGADSVDGEGHRQSRRLLHVIPAKRE